MKADEFKVGDTVYCIIHGKGIICQISGSIDYPVLVKFSDGELKRCYTQDGRYVKEGGRALFFEEIIIPESAYKRPRWRAKSGDIYCHICGTGLIMHSAEYNTLENDAHFNTGNYFKTEEQAKESKFYKVFHEEE